MSTKNIVPRADGEGGLGTSAKKWLNGFFKNITVQTEANVPTPSDSDNSTKAATTAFVENTFFAKLVTKLAANTAASISSLNTSSLFYRMLSWALTASGVQYNFTNFAAWYICFGSLLGGLIIQGGVTSVTESDGNGYYRDLTFPVSWSNNFYGFYLMRQGAAPTKYSANKQVETSIRLHMDAGGGTLWLGIGK